MVLTWLNRGRPSWIKAFFIATDGTWNKHGFHLKNLRWWIHGRKRRSKKEYENHRLKIADAA